MTLSEYDAMTPHELRLAIEAHNDKLQYEHEQSVMQAYLTAAWQRSKKMPRLTDVLRKMKPKEPLKPQTPEEQIRRVMQWQKRFEKGES